MRYFMKTPPMPDTLRPPHDAAPQAPAGYDALAATDALGALGATHPRISLDDLEAAIAREDYINAGEAVGEGPYASPLSLMTVCFLTMRNGFVVVGHSAPASPENYDPAKGRAFARENAIRQLWPLMGFVLREALASREVQLRAAQVAAYEAANQFRVGAAYGGVRDWR